MVDVHPSPQVTEEEDDASRFSRLLAEEGGRDERASTKFVRLDDLDSRRLTTNSNVSGDIYKQAFTTIKRVETFSETDEKEEDDVLERKEELPAEKHVEPAQEELPTIPELHNETSEQLDNFKEEEVKVEEPEV